MQTIERRAGPNGGGSEISGQVCTAAALVDAPAVVGAGLVKPRLKLHRAAREAVGLRRLRCTLPYATAVGSCTGVSESGPVAEGLRAHPSLSLRSRWQPVLVVDGPGPLGARGRTGTLAIEALVRVSRDVGDRGALLESMAAQVGALSLRGGGGHCCLVGRPVQYPLCVCSMRGLTPPQAAQTTGIF